MTNRTTDAASVNIPTRSAQRAIGRDLGAGFCTR
jgi:hypothetical protein